MNALPSLLEESAAARASSDWPKLQELSVSILRLLGRTKTLEEKTLLEIVQNYLSSIVGSGQFLTLLSSKSPSDYYNGLAKLETFLKQRNYEFQSVDYVIQAARQIALLSLDSTLSNRNKISSYLRKIARPDISIEICKQVLEISRLNYYALTILCSAYCDLAEFDKAIECAEKALKHQPQEGKSYVLNALTRAHTQKFKSIGDFGEIEKALDYGHKSLELKLDVYSANSFIAAAIASGYEQEIEHAKDALLKAEPEIRKPEVEAIFQAFQAAQALTPHVSVVEAIDELDDQIYVGAFDSVFELVNKDEGFSPTVLNVRKMPERFHSEGWFLQGMSNIPCPICDTISLHSYRKHFRRYGKTMHYWCLVCDSCRTATDSIDYARQDFEYISGDLEERFPVQSLCSLCD